MTTPQAPILRGTQLDVAAFVAHLTDQITKMQEEHDMFRSKPNHCISSCRNMSCSSLCPIQLRCHKAAQHHKRRLYCTYNLCYNKGNKRRAINVQLALGSSRKNRNMRLPNVLRCMRPYTLGFFIVYLSRSTS